MASIELFDAAPKELRLLDLAFSETNDSASSWDATPLEERRGRGRGRGRGRSRRQCLTGPARARHARPSPRPRPAPAPARARPPAQVRSASFFTKLPVSALGLTRTARGVTAKQLLLGTPEGQVYMLDRRFVDPARPRLAPGQKQPSPAQAAEGLPVFSPELPLVGASFATLDRRAARLRSIATEPAVLESTSLMAAWGLGEPTGGGGCTAGAALRYAAPAHWLQPEPPPCAAATAAACRALPLQQLRRSPNHVHAIHSPPHTDLFYTRLQPSRQFDMVPDDFPFALLTLVVVGLSAASVVLRRVSGARMLQRMWA